MCFVIFLGLCWFSYIQVHKDPLLGFTIEDIITSFSRGFQFGETRKCLLQQMMNQDQLNAFLPINLIFHCQVSVRINNKKIKKTYLLISLI